MLLAFSSYFGIFEIELLSKRRQSSATTRNVFFRQISLFQSAELCWTDYKVTSILTNAIHKKIH